MTETPSTRRYAISDDRLALRTRGASRLAVGTRPLTPIAVVGDEHSDIRYEDVARLVHDFKNPLSTISLEAEVLEYRVASPDPLDVHLASERILRNVEFLDRMVMDLLDLCSLKVGHLELQRTQTEVRALLERVIDRVVPSRDAGRVSLEPSERALVDIDDLRIERVVANLIANALKYAPARTGIAVRLEREPSLVRVSVLDDGSSLTDIEMSYIFDAYRRGRRDVAVEGTGLGLYVSKRIVEAHGGTIGVGRRPVAGTRFYFELPVDLGAG